MDMCEAKLSEEQKSELRAGLSNNSELAEKLCVLSVDELINLGKTIQLRTLMNKQYMPSDEDIYSIEIIMDSYSDGGNLWAASQVFTYGRIQGIRAERARRKSKQ